MCWAKNEYPIIFTLQTAMVNVTNSKVSLIWIFISIPIGSTQKHSQLISFLLLIYSTGDKIQNCRAMNTDRCAVVKVHGYVSVCVCVCLTVCTQLFIQNIVDSSIVYLYELEALTILFVSQLAIQTLSVATILMKRRIWRAIQKNIINK